MTGYSPDFNGQQAQFDQFRTTIQMRSADVRFAYIGGELLVVGTVREYAEKTAIETDARRYGLTVQNCVRVVPGHDWLAERGRVAS